MICVYNLATINNHKLGDVRIGRHQEDFKENTTTLNIKIYKEETPA